MLLPTLELEFRPPGNWGIFLFKETSKIKLEGGIKTQRVKGLQYGHWPC